jgi:hypothetical protein
MPNHGRPDKSSERPVRPSVINREQVLGETVADPSP